MKNIKKSRPGPLPLRPEPFVYRVEIDPEAGWVGSALDEVLKFSTVVQIEALKGLSDKLLQLVQSLDLQQQDFKLRLLLPSDENNFGPYLIPLSKLKKSVTLLFLTNLVSESLAKNQKDRLFKMLAAFSTAGLKTGLMLELAPEADPGIADLENLIIPARQAGALEIALRPSRPLSISPVAGNSYRTNFLNFLNFLTGLSSRGVPLALEECFPGAWPDLEGVGLNCRQAFGSCFIDRNGLVRSCRLSDTVLGDLKQEHLKDIFSRYVFSDGQYCLLEWARLQKSEPEPLPNSDLRPASSAKACPVTAADSTSVTGPAPTLPSSSNLNAIPTPTTSAEPASFSPPVILDSSLKPVPLFRLLDRPWGTTVVHDYDGLVLTPKGARLARSIDGCHDLRWLKKKFGEKALSFVCGLFLKGYIRLEK